MFIPLASILITMLLTSEASTKSGWKQLGFHRYFHLDYQEKESKRVALKLTYD